MQERVARLTAMDSAGTSGGGVVLNVTRTATELGVTTDRVWVHFRALVKAGWFIQTVKPTRGLGGGPGRRARYQCTRPTLDLGLLSATDLPDPEPLPFDDGPVDNEDRLLKRRPSPIDDEAQNRLLVPQSEARSDSPTPAESSIGLDPNRLLVSAESSIGAERENNRLSTSDGSPSDELPPTPVPQEPKPQDRARPVDKPGVRPGWEDILVGVRANLAAASARNARHARPTPTPIARPERE